jgi:hypothetical protein
MNDISMIISNLFAMQQTSKPGRASFYLFIIYVITVRVAQPITVAARSKAVTVFARSDAGIVGSNPLKAWMSVCVCSVFVLFYVAG